MTKWLSEEQQTFNALTNNELDECLEELIEHGFHASVFDVFSQATEANRLRELLDKHGICDKCGELFSHDIDEPFATCGCGTGEWYTLTPHMEIQKKFAELKGKSGALLTNLKHLISDLRDKPWHHRTPDEIADRLEKMAEGL